MTAPNGVEFGPETCSDPGDVVGDDGEAAVDVEWASASAPNATIELASCKDTDTNFGAFIAVENLLTSATLPPPIFSLSYGSPESENGTDGNAYINALWQVAVFEGVSVFVSSGDADADVTDQNRPYATHGINVNALASTPNDVAVGGTDYGDTFLGENGVYWNGVNGPNFNSALSYIPEIPWNNSCASQLIAIALGYPTTYGAGGSCNSAVGEAYFLTTAGGSGGPSGCAYGEATTPGVVSGTCTGYPKPSFQTLVYGNPTDGVRDLPEVSMFAANGVWGHYFVLCYSNPAGGGAACPTNNPSAWAGAGGTSFGPPIWAGIQALINQATGSAQGNPDFFYYLLGGTEYGASGSATCNSTLGNATSSSCIFLRCHAGRQRRELPQAGWSGAQLLLSGDESGHERRAVYFEHVVSAGVCDDDGIRFRDGDPDSECLQPGGEFSGSNDSITGAPNSSCKTPRTRRRFAFGGA